MPLPLQLSTVKPDFESLVLQLQVFLDSKGTWSDLLASSTGETLIEMMAAIGAFNQFAIESGAREGFLSTAMRDSSIYAITRMLGVRISRKSPASVPCKLTRGSNAAFPALIPKYSQFQVGGRNFFNRQAILFAAGAAQSDVHLFEGEVRVETFAADSSTFREIYLSEAGFSISDFDVTVEIVNPTTGESVLWSPIDQGIWTAEPADFVYYDSTSGLGETVLAFGDGYHGALPPIGTNIRVSYAVTNGAVGNNGGADQEVVLLSDETITGVTTAAVTGGANQKPASYYKSLAPHLYKARTRAVTPGDYSAVVSSYPNVVSCAVQTQKDIAPMDLRWMNVVRVCILPEDETEDSFSVAEWEAFDAWFRKRAHAAVHIQHYNPIKLVRNVSVKLALRNTATAAEIVPVVDSNIRALFSRNVTTLGRRIALSDIVDACDIEGVDYTEVLQPTQTLVVPSGVLGPLHYFALGNLAISAVYSDRAYYKSETVH